jgi:hypothetical protein
MFLLKFAQWLNDTSWSSWIRDSDLPFPIIETVHVMALGLSVGIIMWIDMRLMGLVMKRERMSEMLKQIEPWAIVGFSIMFISGALLILAEPLKCYNSTAFRFKAAFLILAGANVWLFHRGIYKTIVRWDNEEVFPWQARLCGFLSLILWFGIIVAGRWTAVSS